VNVEENLEKHCFLRYFDLAGYYFTNSSSQKSKMVAESEDDWIALTAVNNPSIGVNTQSCKQPNIS
jgi:hypothetical protein